MGANLRDCHPKRRRQGDVRSDRLPGMVEESVPDASSGPLETVEVLLRSAAESSDRAARQNLVSQFLNRFSNLPAPIQQQLDPAAIAAVEWQFDRDDRYRVQLLRCLALIGTPASLELLVERLTAAPPADGRHGAYALSPLFQRRDWPVEAVFPGLLDGLEHPSIVVSVLDLANYVTRQRMVAQHPAWTHRQTLIDLLSGTQGRLGQLASEPQAFGATVSEIQRVLSDGIALCVSLCDALGWCDEPRAVGKLRQAAELPHRRIQLEAAAALARLGEAEGRDRLIDLAADPAARLRALAYAEELQLIDEIPPEHRSEEARAVAELAAWLGQPEQFGVAPGQLEVIDARRQYWPSFEEPQQCYLIRFAYRLGPSRPADEAGFDHGTMEQAGRTYSNIGIAGPLVHAVAADLQDLPIDDIYALFAGWQAEHDDLFTVQPAHWNRAQRSRIEELGVQLQDRGYDDLQPHSLGVLFESSAWIGSATREGSQGFIAFDGSELVWAPQSGRTRPLQQEDVWNLYKGRQMLRTFNRPHG